MKPLQTIRCLVQTDPNTGSWIGSVPDLPGVQTQGQTLDELKANLYEVLSVLKEHQTVEIRKDLPHLNLEAGASGVVVHVYPNGVAYEVEFIGEDGRTLGVETLEYDELTPQQIAGIRSDAEKHLPSDRVISRQSLFSDVLPDLHITCTQELDGRHLAEVPELSGVMCHGLTPHEAMAKVQALALRVLADRLESGESVASSFTFRI